MNLQRIANASAAVFGIQVVLFFTSIGFLLTKGMAHVGIVLFFADAFLAIVYNAILGTVVDLVYFSKHHAYEAAFLNSRGVFRRFRYDRFLYQTAKVIGDKAAVRFLFLQLWSVCSMLLHLIVMIALLLFVHPEMLG